MRTSRKVTLLWGLFALATTAHAVDLDQGWDGQTLGNWQQLSQGSRYIPLSWAQALEAPGQQSRFITERNLANYGYTAYQAQYQGRTLLLPAGFVPDDNNDRHLSYTRLRWYAGQGDREAWLGMNCSACHTSTVRYQGQAMVVQGGPTNADFQAFFNDMERAMRETERDATKFERFAQAVLGNQDSRGNRQQLMQSLARLNAFMPAIASSMAMPSSTAPGGLMRSAISSTKSARSAGRPTRRPTPPTHRSATRSCGTCRSMTRCSGTAWCRTSA